MLVSSSRCHPYSCLYRLLCLNDSQLTSADRCRIFDSRCVADFCVRGVCGCHYCDFSMDLPRKDSAIYVNMQIFWLRCPTFRVRRCTVLSSYSMLHNLICGTCGRQKLRMCTPILQLILLHTNQCHALDGHGYEFSIWQCEMSSPSFLYSYLGPATCNSQNIGTLLALVP